MSISTDKASRWTQVSGRFRLLWLRDSLQKINSALKDRSVLFTLCLIFLAVFVGGATLWPVKLCNLSSYYFEIRYKDPNGNTQSIVEKVSAEPPLTDFRKGILNLPSDQPFNVVLTGDSSLEGCQIEAKVSSSKPVLSEVYVSGNVVTFAPETSLSGITYTVTFIIKSSDRIKTIRGHLETK